MDKPRQPIPKASKARAILNRDYANTKRQWRKELKAAGNWQCGMPFCERAPGRSPHHTRGRTAKLLCAVQFWLPICNRCHDWIHNNIEAARKLGMICERGNWGRQP